MPYKRTKQEVETLSDEHRYVAIAGDLAMESQTISVYADSTLVHSPEVDIRGRWLGDDCGFVGQDLLLNFRPENSRIGFQLGVGKYLAPDAVLAASHAELGEDHSDSLELPKPKRFKQGLSVVADSRRSTRDFSGQPVSLQDFSTMLGFAQGSSGSMPVGHPLEPQASLTLRRYPSGGGLYPIGLYVLAFNVAGLVSGIYHYLPYSHRLSKVNLEIDRKALVRLAISPDFDAETASFAIAYVYDLYANARKYGDAGVVYGLIEVGSISQCVHLARTALGLAGCDQGGYDKPTLEHHLGLDGMVKHVVHFTVIGTEG